METAENVTVADYALQLLATELLVAAGADEAEAAVVAEILVWGDLTERPNQGVWRLPVLCQRLRRRLYTSPCTSEVTMRTPSLGCVDAGNGLGHYVAHQAMLVAIEQAKQAGICALLVKGSNFLGANGYYSAMAAERGMIGIVLSNAYPKVRAQGGDFAVLGTNPLSFACPAIEGAPLIVDMATSTRSGSSVRREREGASPERQGRSRSADLLDPLGGGKGFGLALMVEILSGVLSGAGFSHQVNSMYENLSKPGENGHFLLAIDIQRLMPLEQFSQRMGQLIEWLRQSGDEQQLVRYPGERRGAALQRNSDKGVALDGSTLRKLRQLSDELGVAKASALDSD